MSSVAERVAKGAALLDEREPGWAERIDLGRLKMSDRWECVLGQLFADEYEDNPGNSLSPFSEGIFALDLSAGFAHGFDDDDCDYPALAAEWARVITERRSA